MHKNFKKNGHSLQVQLTIQKISKTGLYLRKIKSKLKHMMLNVIV